MLHRITDAFNEGREYTREFYRTIDGVLPVESHLENNERRSEKICKDYSFIEYLAYLLGAVGEQKVSHVLGVGKYKNKVCYDDEGRLISCL